MGLLDDAIREHLELKRRRGADPGEVARQEREILGPEDGGPEPGDAPAPLPVIDDLEVLDDLNGGEPDLEPPVPEVGADEGDDEEVWDDATTAVVEQASPPTAEFSVADLEEERGAAALEDDDEISFFDDEPEPEIVPADEEPDGEDLLDQTPDFLEETPEHDRLWFEQRPPRDFDFGN